MLHVAGAKIVFYMHGNSGSRAASHRIELYQVLREQGYHVIAFGESTFVRFEVSCKNIHFILSKQNYRLSWLWRLTASIAH